VSKSSETKRPKDFGLPDERWRRTLKELADLKFALDESAIVAITDQTGKITYVNDKFCEISKFSQEELIGQDHRIISSGYHPKEFIRELWTTIANGKTWRGELRNRAKDGSIYWVDTTIVPFLNESERPYQYVAIRNDVTERKQAAETIREQAELLDVSQCPTKVRAMTGEILYWNKSAENLYGWTKDEVIGKNFDEQLYGTSQKLKEILEITLEKGEWRGDMRQLRRNGESVIVESRWTLVRNERNEPKSFLVVNTDVTERKQIETQLLQSQRMESIGALAAGIAHDLNNVLSPMLMSVQFLKRKHSDEESQKWLSALRENAERGASLIKQLLTFARGTESDKLPLQPHHLIKEVIRILRETLPKSINIRFFIPDDLWTISADPTQVHQVLMNLSVNARDAMPQGGTLTLKAENVTRDATYLSTHHKARTGQFVVITIGDTGEGIVPENLDKIFDPFFTTKGIGKGTGLGLSTVAGIMKGHSGFIDVYSEPGKGSRFDVYFPAIAAIEGQDAEVVDVEIPKGNGEYILVVDDEELIRDVSRITLEQYNYSVLTAANGAEALDIYQTGQNEIAVVITDSLMPVMDGEALISALSKINPQIKIVHTSGLLEINKPDLPRPYAVETYLSKPFSAEKLLETVARVLDKI